MPTAPTTAPRYAAENEPAATANVKAKPAEGGGEGDGRNASTQAPSNPFCYPETGPGR